MWGYIMKKNAKDKSSGMSPRELARYAVVNTRIYKKDEMQELDDWEYSFYENHLKSLNKDEYIEYLEQVIKETDYDKMRLFYDMCRRFNKAYLLFMEMRSINDNSQYRIEQIRDAEKSLRESEDILSRMEEELANSKYITTPHKSDVLTKGYWEKKSK